GLDHVEEAEEEEGSDCAAPADRVHEQRDQHAHHLVDHDLSGIGPAVEVLGDITTPRTEDEEGDDRERVTERRGREQPPEQESGGRSKSPRRDRGVADAEHGRRHQRQQGSGIVLLFHRGSGIVSDFHSGSGMVSWRGTAVRICHPHASDYREKRVKRWFSRSWRIPSVARGSLDAERDLVTVLSLDAMCCFAARTCSSNDQESTFESRHRWSTAEKAHEIRLAAGMTPRNDSRPRVENWRRGETIPDPYARTTRVPANRSCRPR